MADGVTSIEELEWEKLGPVTFDPKLKRLNYVISQLQEADELESELTWRSDVAEGVTVEELLGALGEAMHLINYVDELEDEFVETEEDLTNFYSLRSTIQDLEETAGALDGQLSTLTEEFNEIHPEGVHRNQE